MDNTIKFKDKLGRKWEIDFPEYIWKIYKGTNPEYIMERLIEVCSDIDECEEYIVNHDTIIAYGIYLTMIQINYEDRFVNVATADYIYRKSEKLAHYCFMENIGMDMQEFRARIHTKHELQLIAASINESKEPYYKDYFYIPVKTNSNDGFIDHYTCFGKCDIIKLVNMFHDMMFNFKWNDISNLIYSHSIFGMAYHNSVERLVWRSDGENIYIAPDLVTITEEFKKLLIKYHYRGFKVNDYIMEQYMRG